MKQLFEDDKNKMSYSKDIKRDKRSSLNKINQQDKFIFKSIDMVLEGIYFGHTKTKLNEYCKNLYLS